MLDVVKYEGNGGLVEFTAQEVKARLCPNIDDKELAFVMALCSSQKLNPFTKDVYIIKYGDNPAQIVTSKEVFTKRAQANPKFEGMQAGLTFLTQDGQIIQREGSMAIQGWSLIGAWCKVYIKGYRVPIYDEVALSEYDTGKSNWRKMPGTMIRKVALCHALREAFPDDFQGLYGAEEMGNETVIQAEYEEAETVQPVQPVEAEVIAQSDESIDALEQEVLQLADQFGFACCKSTEEALNAALMTNTVQGMGACLRFDQATPEQLVTMRGILTQWLDTVYQNNEADNG